MSLTEAVRFAAGSVARAGADPDALSRVLGTFLSSFVGEPFMVGPRMLGGPEGRRTKKFASAVFAALEGDASVPDGGTVPVQRTAAVVDACDELTLGGLREAYARIAEAKRLRQAVLPACGESGHRDGVLGVVLGLRSAVTLEAIAEDMQRLNEVTPATEWPDLVAIADTGTVQYCMQFPGENVTADFFLPDAKVPYAAPVYIVMIMRPAGAHTLNRMLAFIVAHLALFAPGADVPRFPDVVEGLPDIGLVLTGYQCNLSGELVPVPRHFYSDRFLPLLPFTIEDGSGAVLATVQFLPWQDGGVIILRGKLPLETLFKFLGRGAAKAAGIISRPGGQISYAMPIREADFQELLKRFQSQSNLVVRPDRQNLVVMKFADEGSSSPFMARLLLGMLTLRDAALPEASGRDAFDRAYQSAMTPLLDARARMKNIARVWQSHAQRVQSGEVARVQRGVVHVDENVNRELGQEVDAFLGAATRALKSGMPAVAGSLGTDIGFLFQRQAGFEARVTALEASDPPLAAYLRQARAQWSETLVGRRNAVEHDSWRLPDVVYWPDNATVHVQEPPVDNTPVTVFTQTMIDRLSCFAEEVTAHLLQRRLVQSLTITELPLAERKDEAPERFRVTLSVSGSPPWTIAYHSTPFEEA